MRADTDTVRIEPGAHAGSPEVSTLVLVWSQGRPACRGLAIGAGPVVLGRRDPDNPDGLADDCISRRHVEISREGSWLRVRDLGSRNGSHADGARVGDRCFERWPRVLRLGHSLLVPEHSPPPSRPLVVRVDDGEVVGPRLAAAREEIECAARAGEGLLITGPTGSGKELAARHYHASSRRTGRFVAINCSAIPAGLAERLLFGARRGAYSGADADVPGYVQEADGGTLFLDEVAELDPLVQPKLLRLLEEREYFEVGSSRPRKVDLRVCAATHKNLLGEASEGRFREDLFYRLGRAEVTLPHLARCPTDIPYLVELHARHVSPELTVTACFVEACLLHPWPGNVRQLGTEVRKAARKALSLGAMTLDAAHLAPPRASTWGAPLLPVSTVDRRDAVPHPREAGPDSSREASVPATRAEEGEVLAALRQCGGNVSGAARALGWHRTQLRRWIDKHGTSRIEPARDCPPGG